MYGHTYRIRTAHGVREVAPEEGHTLPHEHVVLDLRVWWTGEGPWDALDPPGVDLVNLPAEVARAPEATARENMVLSDWYVAAKEMRAARETGLQLLVDLTTRGLDPHYDLAVRAADLAGVDIVVSVGRYLAASLAEAERARTVEDLAEEWTRQIAEGIVGFTPGIIGEIGTGLEIEKAEVTSLRAAARVQADSGLALNVHVHPYARRALEALSILADEGADLAKVGVSHCDGELDLDWLERILRTSCYVELDQFGTGPERLIQGRGYPSDDDRVNAIKELCDRGWAERLLLSHDLCHRNSLLRHGGSGYGHIGSSVAPALATAVGQETAHQLIAVNPLQFLDITGSAVDGRQGPPLRQE
jgi:phosphotriesterase-related protein